MNTKDENPAKKIVNFTKHANSILTELNKARTKPSYYLAKLQDLLNVEDEVVKMTFDGNSIIINDGKEAIITAIEFLLEQKPLEPLALSKGLFLSAEDLLTFLVLHDGIETHEKEVNAKKYTLDIRASNYGTALGELTEIIDYGNFNPEMLVLGIIISDGDCQKREREILFSNILGFVGVSSNILPSERVCTVINFAEHFFEENQDIPKKLFEKYTDENSYKNTQETVFRENKVTNNSNKMRFQRKGSNEIYQKKKKLFINNENKGDELFKSHNVEKVKNEEDEDGEEEYENENEKEEILNTYKSNKEKKLNHESVPNKPITKTLEQVCEEEILNEDIKEIQIFEKPMLGKNGIKFTLTKKTVFYFDGSNEVTTTKH